MGNTLTTSRNNRNINESILGKRVQQILLDQDIVLDISTDKNGNEIIKHGKINKMRGCCMDIVKEAPNINDFITINLPDALDKPDSINNSKVGLQIKGDRKKICDKNYTPGTNGICNSFLSNTCAKQIYDSGCLVVKKNAKGKKVRIWDRNNSKCFNKDGSLIYGNEECACINSATGFTLNTDPSKSIIGGVEFESNAENPYGIDGEPNNSSSKYSLNIFGYDNQYQKPQIFDSRCSSRIDRSSVQSGESAVYLLPGYANKNLSICMNQINIKDSDIGAANFSNIKQNNSCGGGPPKIEEKPVIRPVVVKEDIKVDKKLMDTKEENAAKTLEKEKKYQERLAKISNDQVLKDEKQKVDLKQKDEEIKKVKKAAVIAKINTNEKVMEDKAKLATELKKSEKENEQSQKEIQQTQDKNKQLKQEQELIKKQNLQKQQQQQQEIKRREFQQKELIEKENESVKKKIYYVIGISLFILILIYILLKIKGKSGLDAELDAELVVE